MESGVATVSRGRAAVISPSVEIKLGGRQRHLRLDLNAMALVDEKLKVNMLTGTWSMEIRPSHLKIYVWAALNSGDEGECEPELTDEKTGPALIGRWINFSNAAEVMLAVTEALHLAQSQEGDDDRPDQAEEAGDDDPKNPLSDSLG